MSCLFYSAAVAYLNTYGKHVDDLKDIQYLLLKKFPEQSEFYNAGLILQRKRLNVSINKDCVFNKVAHLQQILNSEVLNDWKVDCTSFSD